MVNLVGGGRPPLVRLRVVQLRIVGNGSELDPQCERLNTRNRDLIAIGIDVRESHICNGLESASAPHSQGPGRLRKSKVAWWALRREEPPE